MKNIRVGTDCSGIEAPIQALLNLKIPFIGTRSPEELLKNKKTGKKVTMHYHVFLLNLGNNFKFKNAKNKFSKSTNLNKNYMETTNMKLIHRKNVNSPEHKWWKLMREKVLPELHKIK